MIWSPEMTQTELAVFFIGGLSLAMAILGGLVYFLIRHPRRGHGDKDTRQHS